MGKAGAKTKSALHRAPAAPMPLPIAKREGVVGTLHLSLRLKFLITTKEGVHEE